MEIAVVELKSTAIGDKMARHLLSSFEERSATLCVSGLSCGLIDRLQFSPFFYVLNLSRLGLAIVTLCRGTGAPVDEHRRPLRIFFDK